MIRVAHVSDYGNGGADQITAVKLDYFVNLGSDWTDKDLTARFETDLQSGRKLWTDLNAFQMDRHDPPARSDQTCTFFDRPGQDCYPIQSQFYPMTTTSYIQDQKQRLSIHSTSPCGVASLKDGWVEVGLDRRLSRDDEKGLMEGVLDNKRTHLSFAEV